MTPIPAQLHALDAALRIEELLIRRTTRQREVTVDRHGRVRTWASGTVPALLRERVIGTYDARATAEMIAEDLCAVPEFAEAHA